MKFLTIRQPWAQLIAVGAKTIETRSWSTSYRGPLAIHAGKAKPTIHHLPGFTDVTGEPVAEGHEFAWLDVKWWPGPDWVYDRSRAVVPLPLGAVVAVCDLVDVVPIVECPPYRKDARRNWSGTIVCQGRPGTLWLAEPGPVHPIHDQLPFGDFTPGRFAWLLDTVRPIDPVPMKGAQGLRDLPAGVVIP